MTLIRCFLIQILESMQVLVHANVVHCDLKPENILLEKYFIIMIIAINFFFSLSSPAIKLIDFGSACLEDRTVYTYIQSRFYRAPEVLVGVKYGASIDMWSLGCISAELFLGNALLQKLFLIFFRTSPISRIFRVQSTLPYHRYARVTHFFNS
jgi:dual specificity protein kinase YAK1